MARIKLGLQDKLYLGNLDSKRDWGYAGDFVQAMWLILQQDDPDDFVIATGEAHSVREFVENAFLEAGIELEWRGSGIEEVGIVAGIKKDPGRSNSELRPKTGDEVVHIDPGYFRPTEVDYLLGDPSKAREKLGWEPTVSFHELVKMMVREDLKEAERDQLCQSEGFRTFNQFE